jgi:hypothetical protein
MGETPVAQSLCTTYITGSYILAQFAGWRQGLRGFHGERWATPPTLRVPALLGWLPHRRPPPAS